jgi:hypothetical protein
MIKSWFNSSRDDDDDCLLIEANFLLYLTYAVITVSSAIFGY